MKNDSEALILLVAEIWAAMDAWCWFTIGTLGVSDRNRYGKAEGSVPRDEVRQHLDREMSYAARHDYDRTQQAMVFGDPQKVVVSLT